MAQYILQTVFFQLLFLLVYELLLKKETFFTYNRWYLLVTPILSLILPMLKIESLGTMVPQEAFVMLPEVYLGEAAASGEAVATSTPTAPDTIHVNWWALAYALGFLASLGMFIKKFRLLKNLYRNKIVTTEKDFRIIEVPNSNLACTFFNTVFLGDQLSPAEKEQILSHELIHVKERHSYDLLVFELLRIVFWFNPLIYIYQSRISTVHEFSADAGVVQKVEKKKYYQQLLNTAFSTQEISFINQFFDGSLIKKRIQMLQKGQSKAIAKFKYLVLLPLMLIMLTYVSCTLDTEDALFEPELKEKVNVNESEDFIIVEVKDVRNQTTEERNKVQSLLTGMTEKGRNVVFVSDNIRTLKYTFDPLTKQTKVEMIGENENSDSSEPEDEIPDVPFAIVDEVPVFPGCENLASNLEKKECMSEQVQQFVNVNFNIDLAQDLGLSGVNRIYVQFRINNTGNIEVLGVRAPHPILEKEAERVVSNLPQMIPGKQQGKEVGVLYALPIAFRMN